MANNVYIGNRYVPVFANPVEWDNLRAYEALTIVTYNGTSYTSRKPVPVGTPLSDTDYWVVTGNYSAQVEAYRQEVSALTSQVSDIAPIVRQNTSDIEVLNTLRKDAPIVLIGDSYGTNNGSGVTLSTDLPTEVSKLITDRTIYSKYANGHGFCNGGFLSNLQNLVISNEEKDKVSDIYVMGGWNDEITLDGITEDAIYSAMTSFKNYANANYPNAKLHLMFISWDFRSTRNISNLVKTWNCYSKCNKCGFAFHGNMAWVLHNKNYMTTDNAHPNEDGVKALADNLSNVIRTGNTSVIYRNLITDFTPANGITISNSANSFVKETLINGEGSIKLSGNTGGNMYVTFSNPTSKLFDGKLIEIASVDIKLFRGYEDTIEIDVPLQLMSTSEVREVVGQYVFKDGKLYIRIPFTTNKDFNPISLEIKYIMMRTASGVADTLS